jgi:D-alanine-D-alanine ligase
LEDVDNIDLPPPLFVKPVAEGTSKGISAASKILNRQALRQACDVLLKQFRQPVLVETFLPGREFTVGIAGTGGQAEVLGTLEIILHPKAEADVYSYRNKEECEDLVHYKLVRPENDGQVRSCEQMALNIWRMLGCRDAGRIDLRCDAEGVPNFIEANLLPGLHPQHSDLPILCSSLGISYVSLIERIVQSALQRTVKETTTVRGRQAQVSRSPAGLSSAPRAPHKANPSPFCKKE